MSTASLIAPLLQPLQVRGVTLPNRIMMSPMARGVPENGVPGEAFGTYLRRRAEGGVGTVMVGSVVVQHDGTIGGFDMGPGRTTPFLWGDEVITGWQEVLATVHAAGGLVFPQLMHIGVMRPASVPPYYSPSGTWGPTDRPTSYSKDDIAKFDRPGIAMSESDIQDVIDAFAAGAANAKAAGFDGIAIHGGHGYLIDNFLWAGTNLRTDQWGGDAVQRTAFAVALIKAVRAAIGEAMPISFRFSQWKPQDFDGRLAETPEELAAILAPMADAGVDIFEASARDFKEPAFADRPGNLSYWTRKVTGALTVMVGGTSVQREKYQGTMTPPKTVNNLDDVMRRYEAGEFDLLAVGRALLNDPFWLKRARDGEDFLEFNPRCLSTSYTE